MRLISLKTLDYGRKYWIWLLSQMMKNRFVLNFGTDVFLPHLPQRICTLVLRRLTGCVKLQSVELVTNLSPLLEIVKAVLSQEDSCKRCWSTQSSIILMVCQERLGNLHMCVYMYIALNCVCPEQPAESSLWNRECHCREPYSSFPLIICPFE